MFTFCETFSINQRCIKMLSQCCKNFFFEQITLTVFQTVWGTGRTFVEIRNHSHIPFCCLSVEYQKMLQLCICNVNSPMLPTKFLDNTVLTLCVFLGSYLSWIRITFALKCVTVSGFPLAPYACSTSYF